MTSEEAVVGARVVCIDECDGKYFANITGTICVVLDSDDSYDIGVEFDENIKGHDCNGHAESGHGRFGFLDEFELLDAPSPIPLFDISFESVMN